MYYITLTTEVKSWMDYNIILFYADVINPFYKFHAV